MTKIRAVNIYASGHEGGTKDRLGRNQKGFSHQNFLTQEYFSVINLLLDAAGSLIPRKATESWNGVGWKGLYKRGHHPPGQVTWNGTKVSN